jgi:hypothetical protein
VKCSYRANMNLDRMNNPHTAAAAAAAAAAACSQCHNCADNAICYTVDSKSRPIRVMHTSTTPKCI